MKKKSKPRMREYPLEKVFELIEPGPVVLLTTKKGEKANIMTMSWLMPMEFEPALIGCVVSEANYSFKALKKAEECVIAIPTVDIAATVVDVGNCDGEKIDKFEEFCLTPVPARKVKPPLVGECLANLECRVVDTALVNKYNFFVLKVVKAWHNPRRKEKRTIHAVGDGTFRVDGRTINLKKRMVKWPEFI